MLNEAIFAKCKSLNLKNEDPAGGTKLKNILDNR